MPEQNVRVRYFVFGAMAVLALLVLILLIINWDLRRDLNQNQARVGRIEARDVAEDASRRTAEVATCFATARNRPALEVILRLIAANAETAADRMIVNQAISDYINRAPTIERCNQLAVDNGLDPKDFPPTVRGESGTRP